MAVKRHKRGIKLIDFFLLFFFCLALEGASIKVRVIVDNARVKATPEVVGKTLARVPLYTVLDAEEKQGEWYRVYLEQGGVQISGFLYETYVEVVKEGDVASQIVGVRPGPARDQAEIIVGIESKIEEAKSLVREGKDFEKAIDQLRRLIAKVFLVTDNNRQRELATQIYFWIGLSYAGQVDIVSAMTEFKNMFEIDHAYAKEITRNIFDPKVVDLIKVAENAFLGKITRYSIDVSTVPPEAKIKINGKEVGLSPREYSSELPKLVLEIEKAGYVPIKEEILLIEAYTKKSYDLEPSGRDVEIRSTPEGAKVYLDEKDTGKVTNCSLPLISFGLHKIKVLKEDYYKWEEGVKVEASETPFQIEVELTAKEYKSVSVIGGPNRETFLQPKAIALDKNNNIYIADSSKNKIIKTSSELQRQPSWGDGGKEFKVIKEPAGIAVDNQGYIYVTDSREHSVIKFDKNGRYAAKWGKQGIEDQDFDSPLGIAVDNNNDIYVVDSRNHRLKKYSDRGVLKKIWGKRGAEEGSFFYPSAVAVNQANEVFVIDRNRLQKFSLEGEFIAAWGKPGVGDGEYNLAMGLYTDQKNFIYVADSNNNRIQKFNRNGNFIIKWGSNGAEKDQLGFPIGVAVDSRGYVFVVERDNKRIQVFSMVPEGES